MVVTTKLQDGSVGDTSTGEGVAIEETFTGGCAVRNISCAITALLTWACPVSLTALSAAYQRTNNTGVESTCALPMGTAVDGFGKSNALEWSLDGVTWTPLTITSGGGDSGTLAASFSAVTAKYARIVLESTLESYDDYQITRELTIDVTDFRHTAEMLAPQDVPGNLRGLGACEGAQLTWEWDACACCTGYDIQADGGSIVDVGNVLEYVLSPVSVPSAHTLRVRGYNAAGDGPWAELELTSCAIGVSYPVLNTVEDCEGAQVSLWADAYTGATAWRIYRTDPTGTYLIADLSVRPTEEAPYIDAPRPIGVTATYYLIIETGSGDSPASVSIEVTPCLDGCDCGPWTSPAAATTNWSQQRCAG